MTDRKAALELAARARKDLEAAGELASNRRIADEIYGFIAQQAAEKLLKAWLALLGRRYSVVHDLGQLLRELSEAGADVSRFRGLIDLNPYAVQYRYEAFGGQAPGLDRIHTLRMVRELAAEVEGLMSGGSGSSGTKEPPARYGTGRRTRKVSRGRRRGKK